MEAHSTICPGCGLGCGLYLLREGATKSMILHRKHSAVNAGKLCKFGMQIHRFYDRERLRTTAGGENVSEEEAVKEVRERLETFRREEIAFLAVPSTLTNEEVLAFLSLVSELKVENFSLGGFERFFSVADSEIFAGKPLDEVERAHKLLLFFIDPFVQYPLLARRILRAKQKGGATIIDVSFAENERAKGIYDETILAEVGDMFRDFGELASEVANALLKDGDKLENALILADMNPLSPPEFVSATISLAKETKSQVFFLKPFLNANGANLISASMKMRGRDIFEILNDVKEGKIKCLFMLETGLFNCGFGKDALTSGNLEFLVVQDAFRSEISDIADITICSEPFFLKRGTVVNVEGRVLSAGGDSQRTVEILERMSGAGRTYEEVQEEVFNRLGISKLNEYESFVSAFVESSEEKWKKGKTAEKKEAASKEKKAGETKTKEEEAGTITQLLWLKTSPFFWHLPEEIRKGGSGKRKEEAIVEISPSLAKRLNLFRGEALEIQHKGERMRVAFRIAEIPSYLMISSDRIARDGILLSVKVRKAR